MSRDAILVVDDEESTRAFLSDFLGSRGYKVEAVATGEEAVARITRGDPPAVTLLDLLLPDIDGLEVLTRVKNANGSLPVIIMSAVGQTKTVVEAVKRGASDYLVKPFEEQELELAIENALEKHRLREEVKSLRKQLDQFAETDLISISPKMQRIREIAKQVADTDASVLISGESGVGKEVVARYIHTLSKRRDRPFLRVNCAALPNDLLESELFGYERGAFTGAMSEKPGKFELAGKGSILLDEIGEMSPHLQAKLLHVLQDGEYTRLGAKRPQHVDARVLASTNVRIEEAVKKGAFREDLYFRLNVIRLTVPPLRERREDIPLLCNHFTERYGERYKSSVERLPKELMEAILKYDWPGNVRELENAIRRYLILQDLNLVLSELRAPSELARAAPSAGSSLKEVAAYAAEQAEREVALRALQEANWNRKRAAQQLGISYKALLNKLKKWQLENR